MPVGQLNKVTNKTGQLQPSNAGEDGNKKQESGYSWTQDGEEVEFTLIFPSNVDKKKVKVKVLSKLIKVEYDGEVFMEERLYAAVDVDGTAWTVEGRELVVTVEKGEGGVSWPRVTE